MDDVFLIDKKNPERIRKKIFGIPRDFGGIDYYLDQSGKEEILYVIISKVITSEGDLILFVEPHSNILLKEEETYGCSQEVLKYLKEGAPLHAVRQYEEETGKSLLECKEFIDSVYEKVQHDKIST